MQILSSYPSTDANEKAQSSKASTEPSATSDKTGSTTQAPNQQTFSTRAEKFAQLNKEFDINSSKFTITGEFINRLAELKIISSDEASSLSSDLPTTNNTQTTGTLEQIDSATDAIIQRLESAPEASGLIDVLEKSQQILDNLDGANSKKFPIDPATAAAQINQFLQGESANLLTEKEQGVVKDLKTALNIADKLNPLQRTSAEVSKYMEILKRYG